MNNFCLLTGALLGVNEGPAVGLAVVGAKLGLELGCLLAHAWEAPWGSG